jgi:hypothetical protein
VYKNDTAIIKASTNDFKPYQPILRQIKTACNTNCKSAPAFSLPSDEFMFYGFLSQIRAMKHAKKGALKHISKLIDDGEKSYDLLLKYRLDHYEDLNVNLVDRNIRKLENIQEGI